jgi:hypothetical protein
LTCRPIPAVMIKGKQTASAVLLDTVFNFKRTGASECSQVNSMLT